MQDCLRYLAVSVIPYKTLTSNLVNDAEKWHLTTCYLMGHNVPGFTLMVQQSSAVAKSLLNGHVPNDGITWNKVRPDDQRLRKIFGTSGKMQAKLYAVLVK